MALHEHEFGSEGGMVKGSEGGVVKGTCLLISLTRLLCAVFLHCKKLQ